VNLARTAILELTYLSQAFSHDSFAEIFPYSSLSVADDVEGTAPGFTLNVRHRASKMDQPRRPFSM
jgi:hypothetical protein